MAGTTLNDFQKLESKCLKGDKNDLNDFNTLKQYHTYKKIKVNFVILASNLPSSSSKFIKPLKTEHSSCSVIIQNVASYPFTRIYWLY